MAPSGTTAANKSPAASSKDNTNTILIVVIVVVVCAGVLVIGIVTKKAKSAPARHGNVENPVYERRNVGSGHNYEDTPPGDAYLDVTGTESSS
jgi:flagellar basal body-associated protein FliL